MHHRLHMDHVTKMVIFLAQKAIPCPSLCLGSLSFDIEIERFRSLKGSRTECAAEAESMMDSLQSATRLASNLRQVFILGAQSVAQ